MFKEENMPSVMKHKYGKLSLSPKKKKIDRLPETKNKPKDSSTQDSEVSDTKKRLFKKKPPIKKLIMSDIIGVDIEVEM